jgi:hypothetical protein
MNKLEKLKTLLQEVYDEEADSDCNTVTKARQCAKLLKCMNTVEQIQVKEKLAPNAQITQSEYMCLTGDVYAENIDMWILESKKKQDKDWFKTLDNCIQYVLYNYFDVEICEDPETKLQVLAKEYLKK